MNVINLVLFFTIVHSALSGSVPNFLKVSIQHFREIASDGKCNANICFGIDGGGSVQVGDFQRTKDFVIDVVNFLSIDKSVTYSAVQYGRIAYPMSLTTNNTTAFGQAVQKTSLVADSFSSIASGIIYCSVELGKESKRIPKNLKMIIIADSHVKYGRSPIRHADMFRMKYANRSEVFAVGVGFRDDTELVALTRSKKRVFNTKSYNELHAIASDLAAGLCEGKENDMV